MACRFDLPDVEKSLARAVRQLDEAEPFLGIEPLHPRLGLATG